MVVSVRSAWNAVLGVVLAVAVAGLATTVNVQAENCCAQCPSCQQCCDSGFCTVGGGASCEDGEGCQVYCTDDGGVLWTFGCDEC